MVTKAQTRTVANDPRCKASPSGAHYWVLGAPSQEISGVCKYCNARREFRPFQEQTGFNGRTTLPGKRPKQEDLADEA
ncbi:MAG: hypothetical protein FJ318_06630 [SAR202 cluster bacterium]|nr:hypothetical protein [SAR202 cluster bacterium]